MKKTSDEIKMMVAMARSRQTPEKILEELTESEYEEVRRSVFYNPSTPLKCRVRILGESIELKEEILEASSLPAYAGENRDNIPTPPFEYVIELLKDSDRHIRKRAALNLEYYYNDSYHLVKAFRILGNIYDRTILEMLASKQGIPMDIIENIVSTCILEESEELRDSDRLKIIKIIVDRKNLHMNIIEYIVDMCILGEGVLSDLARREIMEVIVYRYRLPEKILFKIIRSGSCYDRILVAESENISGKVIDELLNYEPEVKRALVDNPKTPRSDIEKLYESFRAKYC